MKIGIASPVSVRSLRKYLTSPSHYLDLGLGGTSVNNLIRGLLENGQSISVYTLDPRVKDTITLNGKDLTIYIGHYRQKGWARALDGFHFESTQIRDFILSDKPDIVNAHWSYEYAMGALRTKVPHLITLRDYAWEILRFFGFFKQPYWVARYLLDFAVKRKGRHFNVNSVYMQEKLSSFRPGLPIIANPISEEFIQDTGRPHPGHKFRIVSILNGWSERKNGSTALKAFQLARGKYSNNVAYDIYGPGYGENQVAAQWSAQHNCDNGVSFLGEVSHDELMSSMHNYDILLHPAREESFGNTLIEGLAFGIPVIGGKKSGAVPWVLNYGENGILVDVESEQEIFEGLDKLILGKEIYEKLSRSGLQYVKNRFSSKKIALQYIKLYKKVLMKKGDTQAVCW